MHRTIVAFGYEARSGKDAATDFLLKAYSGCSILKTSFAKALRFEVHQAAQQIAADNQCPIREAMEILCISKGVKYDPFAKPEANDPYGKQRELLQVVGMNRRAECPTYWVDKVAAEIEATNPQLVLISDLRFLSEANWVRSQGGYTVHVHRPENKGLSGPAGQHVSEQQLIGYPFDFLIMNDSSLKQLHTKANQVFHSILQGQLNFESTEA
jgi:deoxynucleotide monophosphate kinase-like protein